MLISVKRTYSEVESTNSLPDSLILKAQNYTNALEIMKKHGELEVWREEFRRKYPGTRPGLTFDQAILHFLYAVVDVTTLRDTDEVMKTFLGGDTGFRLEAKKSAYQMNVLCRVYYMAKPTRSGLLGQHNCFSPLLSKYGKEFFHHISTLASEISEKGVKSPVLLSNLKTSLSHVLNTYREYLNCSQTATDRRLISSLNYLYQTSTKLNLNNFGDYNYGDFILTDIEGKKSLIEALQTAYKNVPEKGTSSDFPLLKYSSYHLNDFNDNIFDTLFLYTHYHLTQLRYNLEDPPFKHNFFSELRDDFLNYLWGVIYNDVDSKYPHYNTLFAAVLHIFSLLRKVYPNSTSKNVSDAVFVSFQGRFVIYDESHTDNEKNKKEACVRMIQYITGILSENDIEVELGSETPGNILTQTVETLQKLYPIIENIGRKTKDLEVLPNDPPLFGTGNFYTLAFPKTKALFQTNIDSDEDFFDKWMLLIVSNLFSNSEAFDQEKVPEVLASNAEQLKSLYYIFHFQVFALEFLWILWTTLRKTNKNLFETMINVIQGYNYKSYNYETMGNLKDKVLSSVSLNEDSCKIISEVYKKINDDKKQTRSFAFEKVVRWWKENDFNKMKHELDDVRRSLIKSRTGKNNENNREEKNVIYDVLGKIDFFQEKVNGFYQLQKEIVQKYNRVLIVLQNME